MADRRRGRVRQGLGRAAASPIWRHRETTRHRRRRLHRFQLRPPPRRPHRRHRHRARQADVRRQPRDRWRGSRSDRVGFVEGDVVRRGARRRISSATTTSSSTSRPSRTTTTRCAIRGRSCRPTSSAPTRCSKRCAPTACATTTSRPTRSTATSSWTTPPGSPSRRRTSRRARTRRPRPDRTCWCGRGCGRSGSRPRSATARTTTGRTSTSRSSSPARSPTCSPASGRSCTASGLNVRDWIHTDDHSSAVLAIVQRGRIGETYLIGADGEKNNREVVEMILTRWADRPTTTTTSTTGPVTTCATRSTGRSCATRLGWRPHYSDFGEGLAATIGWYRANESWWRPQKAATEAQVRRDRSVGTPCGCW